MKYPFYCYCERDIQSPPPPKYKVQQLIRREGPTDGVLTVMAFELDVERSGMMIAKTHGVLPAARY